MVEPAARIRPVVLADQKHIRYLVGRAGMDPIATANRKLYFNPLVLAAWVGFSSIFIQYMNWWPNGQYGFWGFLAPIPAFGSLSIAFMFAIDWANRWGFEERTAHVLRGLDLIDIPTYYTRSPSSGFWILEYGEKFIGIIGLDASLDAESDQAVQDRKLTRDRSGKVVMSKGTSKIATIRHFYVDEPYRAIGMADDLLEFALKHAFNSDKKVEAVRAFDSPLVSYIAKTLNKHGFELEKKTERYGALRWQNSVKILQKSRWASLAEKQ